MKRDPWEDIRHATMDQLVTKAKLSGSGMALNGFTTPEGWPFTVLIAIGSPGNELGLDHVREAMARNASIAPDTQYSFNPKGSVIDQAVAKEREAILGLIYTATCKEACEHLSCSALRSLAAAIRARGTSAR